MSLSFVFVQNHFTWFRTKELFLLKSLLVKIHKLYFTVNYFIESLYPYELLSYVRLQSLSFVLHFFMRNLPFFIGNLARSLVLRVS